MTDRESTHGWLHAESVGFQGIDAADGRQSEECTAARRFHSIEVWRCTHGPGKRAKLWEDEPPSGENLVQQWSLVSIERLPDW